MADRESGKAGIGSRLRLAREYAGLSQGQVAKMLSLHRPSVSEMEANRRRVSTEELKKLSEIYDVSISWLVGEEESEEENDKVKLAAREISKLKPEDLDRVVKLLNALRSKGDNG